jgi:hypothetical protein
MVEISWHSQTKERATENTNSTYTGTPVLNPTWEGLWVKFPRSTLYAPLSPHPSCEKCSVRKATFYERLLDLTRDGRLVCSPEGDWLSSST